MSDGHEARMDLANWFATMLDELDEDYVSDPKVIKDLQRKVASAFADWRIQWGYGVAGPGTGPESPVD